MTARGAQPRPAVFVAGLRQCAGARVALTGRGPHAKRAEILRADEAGDSAVARSPLQAAVQSPSDFLREPPPQRRRRERRAISIARQRVVAAEKPDRQRPVRESWPQQGRRRARDRDAAGCGRARQGVRRRRYRAAADTWRPRRNRSRAVVEAAEPHGLPRRPRVGDAISEPQTGNCAGPGRVEAGDLRRSGRFARRQAERGDAVWTGESGAKNAGGKLGPGGGGRHRARRTRARRDRSRAAGSRRQPLVTQSASTHPDASNGIAGLSRRRGSTAATFLPQAREDGLPAFRAAHDQRRKFSAIPARARAEISPHPRTLGARTSAENVIRFTTAGGTVSTRDRFPRSATAAPRYDPGREEPIHG